MNTIEIDGKNYPLIDLQYCGAYITCPNCGKPLIEVGPVFETTSPQTYDSPEQWRIVAWGYRCEECGGEFYTKDEV